MYIAATISFNQSQYSIVEENGSLELSLLLSNPSSYAITIQVESISGSATGKYIQWLCICDIMLTIL